MYSHLWMAKNSYEIQQDSTTDLWWLKWEQTRRDKERDKVLDLFSEHNMAQHGALKTQGIFPLPCNPSILYAFTLIKD